MYDTRDKNNIQAVVRIKPSLFGEPSSFSSSETTVVVPGEKFTFDKVFQPSDNQADVYQTSIACRVEDLFQGYNVSVIGYGANGAGKTYTMMGDIRSVQDQGIIPRISSQIFQQIRQSSDSLEYTISVSCLEIYKDELRDLLREGPARALKILDVPKQGNVVKGLDQMYVQSESELFQLITRAKKSQNITQPGHTIFQMRLSQRDVCTNELVRSCLSLVDLSNCASLGNLDTVVDALCDGTVVPYRDAKLTRILQDSLGGNSKTTLLLHCTEELRDLPETLLTLRFGTRAKAIVNSVYVNREVGTAELYDRLDSMQQTLKDKDMLIETLQGELSLQREMALGAKLEEAERENHTLKNRLQECDSDAVKNKVEQLNYTIAVLTAHFDNLMRQNERLRNESVNAGKILESRRKRIDALERLVDQENRMVEDESTHIDAKLKFLQARMFSLKMKDQEEFDRESSGDKDLKIVRPMRGGNQKIH